jgi:hypothetical protein
MQNHKKSNIIIFLLKFNLLNDCKTKYFFVKYLDIMVE